MITYDRRGFGRSSKPAVGYNYDTFAADLDVVLKTLDLRDVALVGCLMGTGEVTRYIGKYGTGRVRKAVLIGTLGPYLVKASDNVEAVERSVFEGIKPRAGGQLERGCWCLGDWNAAVRRCLVEDFGKTLRRTQFPR